MQGPCLASGKRPVEGARAEAATFLIAVCQKAHCPERGQPSVGWNALSQGLEERLGKKDPGLSGREGCSAREGEGTLS